MDSQQHGTWRGRWASWIVVALVGLALGRCGVLRLAGQSPFPTTGMPGEVMLTFVDAGGGFPSLFSNQEAVVCIGSQSHRPTQVLGRTDAWQVAVSEEWVLAHVREPIAIRSYDFERPTSGCGSVSASEFDRLDPAQTIYIRNIRTMAALAAQIQYAYDRVKNPTARAMLEAAQRRVVASDAPELWLDERHLNPATGDQVFTELIAAADLLTPLLDAADTGSAWQPSESQPTPTPTAQPILLLSYEDKSAFWSISTLSDDLVRLARDMPMVLALDAELGPTALAPANSQIRAAVRAADDDLWSVPNSAAIAGYRRAWHIGVEALGLR